MQRNKRSKKYQLPFRYSDDEQAIMEALKEVWGYDDLASVVRRSIREAGEQLGANKGTITQQSSAA